MAFTSESVICSTTYHRALQNIIINGRSIYTFTKLWSYFQMIPLNHGRLTLESEVQAIKHQRRLRMQSFNNHRKRFGLQPYKSFEEMTGEWDNLIVVVPLNNLIVIEQINGKACMYPKEFGNYSDTRSTWMSKYYAPVIKLMRWLFLYHIIHAPLN